VSVYGFEEVASWSQEYPENQIIIAEEFSADLESSDVVTRYDDNFLCNCLLTRCGELFPYAKSPTYVNIAINQISHIDYIVASNHKDVANFCILDPDINFSDQLSLLVEVISPE